MAVQLGNAQTAQDYMQIPRTQAVVRGSNASGGSDGEERRADSAGSFLKLLNTPPQTGSEPPEKTPAKAETAPFGEPGGDDGEGSPDGETLPALVNPFTHCMEQMKQLTEAMRPELRERDAGGATAIARDAVVGVSRFDPDLILGEDFADGSPEKGLRDFLASLGSSADDAGDGAGRSEKLFAITRSAEEALSAGDREAASGKLSADAGELLKALERRGPEIAGKRGELCRIVEEAIPSGETESAAALPDEMTAALGGEMGPAAGEARNPEDPAEGFARNSNNDDENKEDEAGRTKGFSVSAPADNAARAASGSRPQRNLQAGLARDFDRDGGAAKNNLAHDPVSPLRASLDRAADAAPDFRPPAAPTLGQPGAVYPLDPNDAFGDGVTTMLLFLKDEGVSEARIVVEPPALGRVDISLQATASGVEATFKVDNEYLKQMLQQQLDSLKNSLQAQGIHVSGLAVDIKNRDDQRRQDAQETNRKIRRLGVAGESGDEETGAKLVRLDLEKSLLHWIA